MKSFRVMTPIFLIIAIVSISCNLAGSVIPAAAAPGADLNATALVQTIQVLSTQNELLLSLASPDVTNTPTPTETSSPTMTPTPTATQTLTPTPTPTQTSVPIVYRYIYIYISPTPYTYNRQNNFDWCRDHRSSCGNDHHYHTPTPRPTRTPTETPTS